MVDEAAVLEGVRRGLITFKDAQDLLGPEAKAEPPAPLAMAVPTGVAKGVSAMAGFPGDVADIMRQALPSVQFEQGAMLPTTQKIRDIVGQVTGMSLPKQTTTAGRYLESGTEGLVSSLLPPATRAGAVLGTLAGLGGEAGEQAIGGPGGRLIGAATPLAIGAWLAGRKPASVKAAQGYIREIGDPELQRAQDVAAGIQERSGVRPLLSQAAETPSGGRTPLTGFANAVRAGPQGATVREILGQGDVAGRRMLGDFQTGISALEPTQAAAAQIFRQPNVYARAGRVFTTGTPDEILDMARGLNGANPDAFPLLFKQWSRTRIEPALGTEAGRVEQGSFVSAIDDIAGAAGTPQRARFEAMVRGLAEAKGWDADSLVRAYSQMMDDIRILGRDQAAAGVVPGLAEAAQSFTSGAFRSVWPLRGLGHLIERVTQRRLLDRVTDFLTSDNGAQILMELGRTSMTRRRIGSVARAVVMGDVQMQDAASITP